MSEPHEAHDSHVSEWLAGTLRWESNLQALRVKHEAAQTRATNPELRAIVEGTAERQISGVRKRVDHIPAELGVDGLGTTEGLHGSRKDTMMVSSVSRASDSM